MDSIRASFSKAKQICIIISLPNIQDSTDDAEDDDDDDDDDDNNKHNKNRPFCVLNSRFL